MSRSKAKGTKFETETVRRFIARGIAARRVVMSGNAKDMGEEYTGDLKVAGLTGECKIRKDGFRELYKWLENDDADFLALRADRKPTLLVIPLDPVGLELFHKMHCERMLEDENYRTAWIEGQREDDDSSPTG